MIDEMQIKLEQSRAVALDMLKPSSRDLDYGLQLHKQALVVESYGLGLYVSDIDTDTIQQADEEGISPSERKDLIEELNMTSWVKSETSRQAYRWLFEQSGVNCTFLNTGEESNHPLTLIKRLARYTYVTDTCPYIVRKATSVTDIRNAQRDGIPSICPTLNGIPLSGNLQDVQEELRYPRIFQQLGVRQVHLTYNRANLLGSGCGEKIDRGLTEFGRHAVKEMNRLGMIIDLAHTGWQTSIDAAKVSEQPVIVSHSAAWSLHQHIRCKTDEVIRAVIATGGTMGITNIPGFLGGRGDLTALLDHIDYVIQNFGDDSVTIGTDMAYRSPQFEKASAAIAPTIKMRGRWESLWPEGSLPYSPEWRQPQQLQSLCWTNWPLITVGLVQRGYTDETIRKVLGENILRVASQVWQQ